MYLKFRLSEIKKAGSPPGFLCTERRSQAPRVLQVAIIEHMEEPSKLFQKIEKLQNVVSPKSNELREGKIVPKTARDMFAIFLNIIVGKIGINILLIKKYKVLLLTLVILSISSVLYLLYGKGYTEINLLYVLSPIILLIVFYMTLRFWAQYRSIIEVVNPTRANMFNALKEQKLDNSAYIVSAKIFSLKMQNIVTRIIWVSFLLFVLISVYLFLSNFWE